MTSPNIVIALLDAARADHFSCYGYNRKTTPFIDEIATNGDLYTSAYSNSIWSLPAYASLFTGKYPSEHKAVDWGQSIDPEENTLIDGVKEQGYKTHAITTHLLSCGHGIADSFDTVEWVTNPNRLPYQNDPVLDLVQKQADTGEISPETFIDAISVMARERSWQTIPNTIQYITRKWRQATGNWKDNGASEIISKAKDIVRETSDPYLLFTNFVETHDPYRPPKNYIREFLPKDVSIKEANRVADSHLVDLSLGIDSLSEREREILVALYDAEIRYIDDELREFVEYLKRRNEFEDTIFIVCSDHGDLFSEWGIWGHQGVIHRDLCRVPLVISTPWNRGKRHTKPVELRNLAQYLNEVASGSQISLKPQSSAVVEYHGWDCQISNEQWTKFDLDQKDRWKAYSASYFTDDWQLLVDSNGNDRLFDLSNGEYPINITHTVENPEVSNRLKEKLISRIGKPQDNHEKYRKHLDNENSLSEASDEVRNHLEDLGYA
ncbi:hypothetical protein DVK05_01345 [Halorubrum sp. Atlit-8R]|uniref:sulfatase n=1 Tax=unclassified Halorubrum TaxID=2642239 RepID=UPI000EF268F0|nr:MULTISPECIES: sulfatase-like hydrolase/transferase [unclassified Halorubrum]RLM72253.1 hypothetical protein DVK08_04420 [Halorubrum sp. Atlit-9R]RLM83304.1 hypothetical protein DVK05_01345 [Halorubrum sp. Atlit-8R]